MGVMGLRCAFLSGKEDDRLMLELVTGYVANLVYNAIELVAQKYRDIEAAQDESSCMCKTWFLIIACPLSNMKRFITPIGSNRLSSG